jgi:hypothetical protein
MSDCPRTAGIVPNCLHCRRWLSNLWLAQGADRKRCKRCSCTDRKRCKRCSCTDRKRWKRRRADCGAQRTAEGRPVCSGKSGWPGERVHAAVGGHAAGRVPIGKRAGNEGLRAAHSKRGERRRYEGGDCSIYRTMWACRRLSAILKQRWRDRWRRGENPSVCIIHAVQGSPAIAYHSYRDWLEKLDSTSVFF